MKYQARINIPIEKHEVPDLRESIGWDRRDKDYPTIFYRCNFWAGIRDENNKLISFGYVAGMGLQHGYMEDIIVHAGYQRHGIGMDLVKELLQEAKRFGLEIVTLTCDAKHAKFYQQCGFNTCSGGVWRSSLL